MLKSVTFRRVLRCHAPQSPPRGRKTRPCNTSVAWAKTYARKVVKLESSGSLYKPPSSASQIGPDRACKLSGLYKRRVECRADLGLDVKDAWSVLCGVVFTARGAVTAAIHGEPLRPTPTAHQKEAFRRAAAQTRLLPPWVRRSSFPRAAGSVSVPARLPNARLGRRLLLAGPRPSAPLMAFEAQVAHGGITNAASRCAEQLVVTLP